MSGGSKRSVPARGGPLVGVANELVLAGIEVVQVLDRRLRDRAGVSLNQFNALRVVAGRRGDEVGAADLIRILGVSSAHATTVLNQLEERGLVERRESTNDRRRRLVSLTAAGEETLDAARPTLAELEDQVSAAIDGQDQAALLRTQLRQIRLTLRHALTAENWDDCVGP